jgi:hypothetical protein
MKRHVKSQNDECEICCEFVVNLLWGQELMHALEKLVCRDSVIVSTHALGRIEM